LTWTSGTGSSWFVTVGAAQDAPGTTGDTV
jgi:hypothetical protein